MVDKKNKDHEAKKSVRQSENIESEYELIHDMTDMADPNRYSENKNICLTPPLPLKGKQPITFADAQLRKIVAQANILEIKYKEKREMTVHKGAVRKEANELGVKLKDAIYQIPARISAICAAETSQKKIETLMYDEFDKAMLLFSRSMENPEIYGYEDEMEEGCQQQAL